MRLHPARLPALFFTVGFALAQAPETVPTYTNADLPQNPHLSVVGTLHVDAAPADMAWVADLRHAMRADRPELLPPMRSSAEAQPEDAWRFRGDYLVGVRWPAWWWWGGRTGRGTPTPHHAGPAPSMHNVDALPAPREGWVGRPTKHLQPNR